MGVKSQRAKFPRGSGHEGSGDLAAAQALFRGGSGLHAASYSLSEPLTFRQAKQAEGVERKAAKAKKRERAKALKRRERAKALALKKKHARIEYVVVPTLKQLGEEESLLPLLVPTDRSVTLLQESNLTIEQRKSRSHFFQIGYESDATGHQLPTTRVPPKGGSKGKAAATGLCLKHGQHLLDLMVTVTYQGVFGARGYRLGRVAATLTRLSPTNDPEAPPTNIGYSPYALQELNTMDSHGKVTILHCPNATPLLHSGYQLTVGCASGSEYCVTVTARLAEDAAVAVERQLKYAKSIQQLLPSLSAELEAIWASMRLLERKLVVTGGMMAEAELEANRCERDTEMCNDELVADGNHAEGLELDDEDRAQVFTEIRTLEVEFAHWARIFAVRAGSREATKGVLNRLAETRREILIRKEKIMSELADLRAFVPAAIGVVEGIACAATAALDLNTSFAPSDKLTARWESKAKSKWARVAAMSKALPPTVTPAAEVRRRHVADGFVSLSLDERQWVMVDQGLNPDKYVWIELEEKAEQKKHKLLCDQCRARGVAPPRRRKKKTVNLAVRSFQFSKEEIERIEHTPYSKLTRKEVQVRRLLGKYHDNSQLLRKPDGGTADEKRQKASKRTAAALLGRGGGSGSSSNGVSGGAGDPFDPNRAQRIRSKRLSKQPEDLTTEETEWVSVDQVVNPQLWPAGVLLKRHKDEARFGQGGGAGPKMKPEMKKQLSKAALRLEQSGFVLPFPLEPELAREVKEEHELKKAKERMERRASRKSGGSSMRSSINSSSSSSSSSADPPLALEGGEESKALTPHSTRRGALVRTSSTALSLAASMSLAAASSPSSSSSSSSSAASSFISAVPKKLSRFSAVLSQAVKSREQSREDSGWRCELDYEQCVEAWGASAHHVVFLSSDERKVHQLLVKISGDASDYQEWVASVSLRNHVLAERKRGVGHIREFPMEKPPAYSVEEGGVAAGGGDGEGPSIDQRCRLLQRELDRCVNNSNAFTDSSVLHGHEQRFPTKVLRIELEREMETVLRATVLAEERVELLLVEQDEDEDDEEEDGENDGDGENEGAEKNKKKKKKGGVHRTGGKKVSKGAGLAAASAASAVDNKGRKENADSDDEEEDGYGSDEEGRVAEKRFQKVMAKRAAVYKKGLVTKRPEKRYKDVVQKVRELVAHENGVDELEREQTREFQELGFGSCFACMANPCRWKPTVDLKQAKQRRQELGDELHYVRMHPSVERFESVVPSSVARGGSRRYRREALVFELEFEDGGWARDQRLCDIDRELHDAWTTTKAYVEVSALSGFKTLLWVGSARKALEVEHSRLVASTLAAELVNEVLEGMREGWYFGEVESKYEAFGYVPSKSVEGVVRLLKERPQDRGVDVEEDDIDADGNGIPDDALEDDPKWQVSDRKAIQPGDHRDEDLKTTEQNIRFGLFTLTLMYFRAMHLMKKQKKMWVKAEMGGSATGGGDGMSDSDEEKEAEDPEVKGLNEHQKRIRLDKIAAHEAKVAQDMGTAVTGQHRTDVREGQERSEAAGSLYGKVRLENMEKAAAGDLQRLYRGHLARKAARRWAMKRNELWALNALLSACAITGQRVYRGYLGRLYAKETRAEMAEFIAMIRMEEAVNDEEEYWRTHSWQRIQRDLKAAKDRLTGADQEVDEDEAAMAAASQIQTQTEKTGGEEDDDGG